MANETVPRRHLGSAMSHEPTPVEQLLGALGDQLCGLRWIGGALPLSGKSEEEAYSLAALQTAIDAAFQTYEALDEAVHQAKMEAEQ